MKSLITLLTFGLLMSAVAQADAQADDASPQLQCKSTYDVTTGDDSLTAKGPSLLTPFTADPNGGQIAGGSKDKTHWGVGYSASYRTLTGRATISITNAQGVNTSLVAFIASDIEAELQMQLDATTRMHVVCSLTKK